MSKIHTWFLQNQLKLTRGLGGGDLVFNI